MLDTKDPEDRQIRLLMLSGAAMLIVTLLALAVVVMILVANNFNVLEWME